MRIAIVLLSLVACASHADGAQTVNPRPEEQVGAADALTKLAKLLLQLQSAAAFNPSGAMRNFGSSSSVNANRIRSSKIMGNQGDDPEVVTGNDWMSEKEAKDKAFKDSTGTDHLSRGHTWESSDTIDMGLLSQEAKDKIASMKLPGYTEGFGGSQGEMDEIAKAKKNADRQLAKDLAINPDVYEVDAEDLEIPPFVVPNPCFPPPEEIVLAASNTGNMFYEVDVAPKTSTYETYFAGFSADSWQGMSVDPASFTGRTDKRKGPATKVGINIESNGVLTGSYVGYLCFMLADDDFFSSFFKITVNIN